MYYEPFNDSNLLIVSEPRPLSYALRRYTDNRSEHNSSICTATLLSPVREFGLTRISTCHTARGEGGRARLATSEPIRNDYSFVFVIVSRTNLPLITSSFRRERVAYRRFHNGGSLFAPSTVFLGVARREKKANGGKGRGGEKEEEDRVRGGEEKARGE